MNMNTLIDRNQLLHQLNWRYATKQFAPEQKISPEDWLTLEEALILTPSSFGLQPWKFIVVTDPVVREKLVPVSWGQRQVADASHLVVFAIKKNLTERDIDAYVNRIAEVRGVSRSSLDGLKTMLMGSIINGMDEAGRQAWSARQVYIALGNFLNSAALLGIDAGPMEGFQADKYDEILGLSQQGLTSVVIAAAGYRAANDKYSTAPKVRFEREDVIAHV